MNIGIIGLGLMGASFGRTINKKTKDKVYGFDIDENIVLKAKLIKAINEELTIKNAKKIDLLIISVFPRIFSKAILPFIEHLKQNVVIMDFCGNKSKICQTMTELSNKFPNYYFIGAHPMAGREYWGIDHSISTLFDNASMLLVPIKTKIEINDFLKKYFLNLGFKEVVFTNYKSHDENIAFTSQLCHIISNAYIKSETATKHFGFSAGSYKDISRVAKLNPDMWTELIIDNRENVIKELNNYIDNLYEYKQAIENNDEKRLHELLKEGNDLKIKIDLGKKNENTNS